MDDAEVKERLGLAERVGRELVRLGLPKHVQHLRRFYADTRAGRPLSKDGWSYGLVQEWARLLRFPPYENDYPVLPRASSCGCPSPQTFTHGVFPGGAKRSSAVTAASPGWSLTARLLR